MHPKYKSLLNTSILIAYAMLILVLLKYEFLLFAFAVFYIPFFVYIIRNWKRVFEKASNFIGTVFFTSGIFFICRIFSEKSLNATFQVDHEFLNYSSSVSGLLAAIPLCIVLTGLFLFLRYWVKVAYYKASSLFTTKYAEEYNSLSFGFRYFVIGGLFLTALPFTYIDSKAQEYYLLLDAYPYSDCNGYAAVDRNVAYIRQNKHACLRVELKGWGRPPVYTSFASPLE